MDQLPHRQPRKAEWYVDGETFLARSNAELDTLKYTDVIFDAYGEMSESIHDRVHQESDAISNSAIAQTIQREYIKLGVNVESQYVQKLQGIEPISTYRATADRTFGVLFSDSVQKNDFSFLLSTIVTLNDPVMAVKLLNEVNGGKQRKPDAIIGDSERILGRIDAYNARVDEKLASLKKYGKKGKQQELAQKMRTASLLGSVALAVQLKIGIGGQAYLRKNFWRPLKNVAGMPTIEHQLVHQALHKVSLIND